MARGAMTAADRARRRAFWRRVEHRLTILEMRHLHFAQALGKSSGTVADWFLRLAMPMGDELLRFPAVLKCSGHWLLTGEGQMEPPGKPSADYRAGVRAALADLQDATDTIRARRGR